MVRFQKDHDIADVQLSRTCPDVAVTYGGRTARLNVLPAMPRLERLAAQLAAGQGKKSDKGLRSD